MTIKLVHTPAGFVSPEDIDHSASPTPGPAAPFGPEYRVVGGVTRHVEGRFNAGTSESNRETYVSTPGAGTAGGSIVATLSSTFGKPSVQLIPGDESSRTTVETAAREGLIRKNAYGLWEDVQGAALEVEAKQEESTEDPGAAVFDKRIDQMWADEIAPLDQIAYDAAVASTMGLIARGNGSLEAVAKSLSVNTGMDPAKAQEHVENGIYVHQQAADKAMGRLGIEGEQLQSMYADFRRDPNRLADVVQKLVYQRDPAALKSWALEWIERAQRSKPGSN